jgi:DNA modification methylase
LSQPALTLLTGDAQRTLAGLEPGSVQTCITSPPFFGLRDYGVRGQVGLEATPAAYVDRLVAVFREVRRVLRDDGTLWLNLGDSFASGEVGRHDTVEYTNSGGLTNKKVSLAPTHKHEGKRRQQARPRTGLGPKQLLGIPWRVAFALQADGWVLRSDVIWAKPNPMPESVRDRPTKSHEFLFLFAKQPRYYYDSEAIKVPTCQADPTNPNYRANGKSGKSRRNREGIPGSQPGQGQLGHRDKQVLRLVANRRTVWTVATQPFSARALGLTDIDHFAAFPPKLIEPCVLAGSRKGDLVLDPFSGAATTGLVALGHGRRYVGIDLNAKYHQIARRRLAAAGLLTQPEPRTRRLAA